MKTRFLVAAGAAALILSPIAAGAGEQADGDLVATPNPATLGQTVTVSNAANEDSTCVEGVVEYLVTDPDGNPFASDTVTPDGSGNWSFQFVPNATGEWIVDASCVRQDTAFPNFPYNGVLVIVQAPGTTVPPTVAPTSSSTTSTTAAAAATVTPAFTG